MAVKVVIVALYVMVMVFIGYLGMRKTKSLADFFLGGRTLGPWLSAFTYGTSYFSAVLFIGFAGSIGWGFGYSGLWIALGNTLVGTLLAWWVLARRTHAMTVHLNALTMPEFFEARYQSPFLKVFSALVIFVFLVPYSASVYKGLSHLFEVNLGIPYGYALTFMAALTAVYLIMGGYHAIAMTDVVQGSVMVVGVIVMVAFIIARAGGFGAATERLGEIHPALTSAVGPPGIIPLLSLVVLTSLGPWGLPQMIQKFYSIRGREMIRKAILVSTVFSIIIAGGAYYSGALTRVFCSPELTPDLFTAEGKPMVDKLMPYLITYAVPGALGVIILLLVLSASMSTLSSLVLVSSSAIAVDLVGHVGRGRMDQSRITALMRLLCALFVVVSVYIALRQPAIIVTLMSISWGTIAGCFLAPFLYGLYWKGTTKGGAIGGAFSGLLISIGLLWFWKFDATLAGSIAMVAPLAVVPLISGVTPRFQRAWVEEVFSCLATGGDGKR